MRIRTGFFHSNGEGARCKTGEKLRTREVVAICDRFDFPIFLQEKAKSERKQRFGWETEEEPLIYADTR